MLPRENVEYGVLGGGCFVKKSRVEIFLRVERSVYKQGQYVRPVVECTVEKGDNLNTSHCSVIFSDLSCVQASATWTLCWCCWCRR